MIKFEPRFVHCFWNDELEGKKGFVADTLADLRSYVEDKAIPYIVELSSSGNEDYQFTYYKDDEITSDYQFCYYDPNYEMKVAYEEGKTIQYLPIGGDNWILCENEPEWNIYRKYRIKPTEEECCVIYYKSTNCFEVVDNTETVFSVDDVFFTGRKQECRKWIKEHNDLQNIIEAYYSGKKIQYFEHGLWIDWTLSKTPMVTSWVGGNWRIKPNDEYEIVIIYGIGLRIIKSIPNGDRKILFTGTKEECEEWLEDNKNIQTAIKGYFSDKPIMYKEKGVKNDPWRPTKDVPYEWDFDHYKYRIATHEEFFKKVHSPKEYVPFENTQELIEAWEKKYPANKDRPNGTMPLIWIRPKDERGRSFLINSFWNESDNYVFVRDIKLTLSELFKYWEFLDGSVCGKKEE